MSESLGCHLLTSHTWFSEFQRFVKWTAPTVSACRVPNSALPWAGITALKQEVQVLCLHRMHDLLEHGEMDSQQTCLLAVGKCSKRTAKQDLDGKANAPSVWNRLPGIPACNGFEPV